MDLSHVTDTGAEHSITVADVERAAESAQPPAAPTIACAACRSERFGSCGDAPRDRRGHGALEAGNSTLLSLDDHRHAPLFGLARCGKRQDDP